MTKLLFIFFLTITFQIIGQTFDVKSSKLEGKWLLKEFNLTSSDGDALDSLKTTFEFKQNGFYTVRYTYNYKDKDPRKVHRPIVISGKWKIIWAKKLLHLYASYEESPFPHQIPDKDAKISKLNKKQFVIYENLIYIKLKSKYTRQID